MSEVFAAKRISHANQKLESHSKPTVHSRASITTSIGAVMYVERHCLARILTQMRACI